MTRRLLIVAAIIYVVYCIFTVIFFIRAVDRVIREEETSWE